MSSIRKPSFAAGTRAAAVLLAAALVVFLSQRGGHADDGDGGEGDKLQGTVTVQIRFSASFETKWAENGASHNDTLIAGCEGTTTYRWTDTQPELGQPSDDLEVLSSNATVSMSGSGKEATDEGVYVRQWTYSPPPTPKQSAFAEVIWRNGKLRIPVPYHCQAFRQTGTNKIGDTTESFSEQGTFGFPPEGTPFYDKLQQSFEKKAKNFQVSGSASWQGKCAAFGLGTCSTALATDRSQQASYTLSYTVSFNTGKPPDVEVELVPPDEYDKWQPQADEDEKTLANFIDVGIVAHKKGDPNKPPGQKILKYTITLADTSREKGVDLNWPPKAPENAAFDLKIDKDNPWITVRDGDAQSAVTKQEDLQEFMVTVNSYDWGGSTKLKVTAELEDHSTVVAHVRGHPDQDFLSIPKDDNLNHIADGWEHWFEIKNAGEDADDDARPLGDGDAGDSIALYDEYRGFHIEGKHERLSPEVKDLFIWDQNRLSPGIYPGVTGVTVHLLRDNERRPEGTHDIASPNGKRQTVYDIWLSKGFIEEGAVGEADGGPGVPAKITRVTIDAALIAAAYGALAGPELQSTIAHELGHATNVWHHGDGPDYSVGDVMCRRPNGTVRNYLCSAPAKGGPRTATDNCYGVAAKGGSFSGNDTCMMRYDMTHFYENPSGNCEWKRGGKTVRGKLYGQDPPGMSICESPRGTGVNDASNPNNKAGDASSGRGECKYKFCLNNKKH